MSRWKRRLIWTATFLFGLYYLVEFLLPEKIGGAVDQNGVGAAAAVNTAQGWQVYYSALSGPRKSDGTADEKLAQYKITRFSLDHPNQRQVVISPSPFRSPDFQGCKCPSILVENGVWKMWYTGLDHQDRIPRIMYTEGRNGLTWSTPVAVITDPVGLQRGLKEIVDRFRDLRDGALQQRLPDAEMDAKLAQLTAAGDDEKKQLREKDGWIVGGIDDVSVGLDGGTYRMWFAALGADANWIGTASSPDGKAWTVDPQPMQVDRKFAAITSVSAYRVAGAWRLLVVGDGKLYEIKDGRAVEAGIPQPRGALSFASVNVAPNANGYLMLLSYLAKVGDGKDQQQDLAVYEGSGLGDWRERGAEVRPGREGLRLVPIPLNTMASWLSIVGAFAVAIGVVGLLQVHIKRLVKRQAGWFNSLSLILSLIAMCVALILFRLLPPEGDDKTLHGWDLFVWKSYMLLWLNMNVPLGSTMFSLLACYLVSAAYRAFRIRGRDATVMAISATLVMLAQVPVGDYLTSWMPRTWQEVAGMPEIRQWYLNLANSAVQRGIAFGVFVGTVAMALRIWLSLDRTGPE